MPRLVPTPPHLRERADRCPGVLRPWVADDGALLRIRLVGGALSREQLRGLGELAGEYGDGTVHLTARANVQLRGVRLPVPDVVAARVEALGLLPSRSHERARNIMVSPGTGRIAGRADLRATAEELDARLRTEPALAHLPGRFLFVLDDRGDLADRPADVAALAVDASLVRLHAGGLAGPVVPLADAPQQMVALAERFLQVRGHGPQAPWHVAELPGGGGDLGPFSLTDRPAPVSPLPLGTLSQDDGRRARHLPVPEGALTPALVGEILDQAGTQIVVTPWRSLLLADLGGAA